MFYHTPDDDDHPQNGSNSNILVYNDRVCRATIEIATVVKKGLLDTWITLEEAKHGLVHLRLSWLQMSADPADLSAVSDRPTDRPTSIDH